MKGDGEPTSRRLVPYAFLAALCAVLFFVRLGATPLIGLDEALYAESSREMVASGNWIVPTYNGTAFFDKPPLCYWLQGACMRAFGVTSFAARLPSAIAALALIALTVFLGTKLFSRRAGLFAGFALATAVYTPALARLSSLDQMFALTISAALGFFLLAYLAVLPRWGYLVFWAATGLTLMVKGPAGAVLILATIEAFLIVRRQPLGLLRTLPIPGLIIVLLIAAPWYVAVQRETGGAFLSEFIFHQNIARALGKDFYHNQPFWFYIPTYLAGFFPWSVFLPLAWITSVRLRPNDKTQEAALFLAAWIVTVIAIFSLLRSKLPSYIYPTYPASALMVGLMWSRAAECAKIDSLRRYAAAALVIGGLLATAMLLGQRLLPKPIPGLSSALIPMGLSLLLGTALAFVLLKLKRTTAAFTALCAGMAVFMLATVLIGLPIAARSLAQPAADLGAVIRSKALPGEPIYTYGLSPRLPSLPFYARRPVTTLGDRMPISGPAIVVEQQERLKDMPNKSTVIAWSGPYVVHRVGRH